MSSIRQRLPVHIVLLFAGVLSLFPLYWLFLTSLSPTQYVVRVPPEIVPRELTAANYVRLFETTPIVRWLFNTVVIAGVITAFHLLFDSMAGYAFAKRRFPGKNVMFWFTKKVAHAHSVHPADGSQRGKCRDHPVCFQLGEERGG